MERRTFLQTATAGIALGATQAEHLGCNTITKTQADGNTEDMDEMSTVRQAAMTMARVDTHSHYMPDFAELRDQCRGLGDVGLYGAMSFAGQLAEGARVLYGIDPGIFLGPDAPPELYAKAAELRALGPAKALETAMDADHIETQFLFSGHRPEYAESGKLSPRVRLLAYIDDAVAGRSRAFCPDEQGMPFNYYEAVGKEFGNPQTLADYADQVEALIDGWRDKGVVGMKVGLAYTTGLAFGNPSLEEAKAAFAKQRDMTGAEIKMVQDCVFRRALLACQRNHLPVVVHTGFQIWGHANLEQSNPMLLHNLFIDPQLKDVQWVLLHGGNPYVGETTYLARMFDNVMIDFTWISWMTRARFRMALAEWIEIVPHTKFCWGSDSGRPENIVGIGRITRAEIANVLDDEIARRVIDEKTAMRFLERCYLENPKRAFQV